MKRFSLLILSILFAGVGFANRLFLAPDSIYYFPYADGTASVSGTAARADYDSLIIATRIMIPDSCLNSNAADPAHMSEYLVTIIGEGAFEVKTYKYVKLPDSLRRIDAQAFLSCTKMATCDLPETVTEIGDLAFFSCNKLTTLNLANIEKLGKQSFARCSAFQNIVLGDKLDTIQQNTFVACSQLQNVSIGSGLKSINKSAFSRCNSLKSIICSALVPPMVDEKAFQYVDLSGVSLQVPCEATDAYSAAPVWKNFAKVEAYKAYSFEVYPYGNNGSINIVSSPNDCNEYAVELEAIPNLDYEFVRWSDNTTNPHYVFTQDRDTILYAYFDLMKKDTVFDTLSLCENNFPYYWSDGEQEFNTAGTHVYNRLGGNKVYSLTIYDLHVDEIDDKEATICQGEFVSWLGKDYSESGTYHDTLVNQYGCDSILTMYLNVIPNYEVTTIAQFYNGHQFISDTYGEVTIERSGDCNNTVTLTAITHNNGYFFSHWRIGEDAIAGNPLILDLDKEQSVRAIFYDNSQTILETLVQSDEFMTIYDVRGQIVYQGIGSEINDLPLGVYILKLGDKIMKVIK